MSTFSAVAMSQVASPTAIEPFSSMPSAFAAA